MGLDIGNARWAYSGFMRFRKRLASAIGVDLDQMQGFGGDRSWANVPDDIVPLLDHSDCEGELTPAECQQIAPRLRALVEAWPVGDYDRIQAFILAQEMDAAVAGNEPLQFS